MIDTISDVFTRISTIEQQVQSLQSGTLLDSTLGVSGGSSPSAAAGSTSSSNFASELAAAQSNGSSAGASSSGGSSTASSTLSALESVLAGTSGGSGLDSSVASGASGASGVSGGLYAGGTTVGTSSLTPAASGQLTSAQQQFASTLSADTGLNPNVVSSWLLAEESGGAAQSRQAAGNNDWLNIGYTDSGTYGASDSVWSDPTTAANATAAWLQGQDSIPGYGTASAGIQSILSTVGQTPAAQIQAIQSSGWSSGGYPSLPEIYQSVGGS